MKSAINKLLQRSIAAVEADIPTGLTIDGDGDDYVDNVTFIVRGNPGAWSSLLWPHRWVLYSEYVYIHGKRVWDFNFQIESMTGASVLCHEFFHSLGAPDLYHYTNDGLSPIGGWDLMSNNSNPPQHMGAWMKYKYGHWISGVTEITESGTYTLDPLTSATNNCYKLASPVSSDEFYILEYRKREGDFETALPSSGLAIYRVNATINGNASGPPDELYIYREDGTLTSNGIISYALFSTENGRTEFNNTTNPRCFLSDDSDGQIRLMSIGSAGDDISFTVIMDNYPPDLITPIANAIDIELQPQLTWEDLEWASEYQIQISEESDFSTTVVSTYVTNSSYTPSTALDMQSQYFWRVKASGNGETTVWSEVRKFTTVNPAGIPILYSPANGATNVNAMPLFDWGAISGATEYTIQISIDNTFASSVYSDTPTDSKYLMPTKLMEGIRYYWRVKAHTAIDESDWSQVRSFTTFISTLDAPTLSEPLEGMKNVAYLPRFDWSDVSGANQYHIRVLKASDQTIAIAINSNTSEYTAIQELEGNTTYIWYVNATDGTNTSEWSNTWSFTTEPLPEGPTLILPYNFENSALVQPNFLWTYPKDAISYHFQLATDFDFENIAYDTDLIDNKLDFENVLEYNTTYYWRVNALDEDGLSDWSETWKFTTKYTPVTLTSPLDASVNQDFDVAVSWQSHPEVNKYHLQISTTTVFEGKSLVKDTFLLNTLEYSYFENQPYTQYYWRVKAIDTENDREGYWSNTWSYKTGIVVAELAKPEDEAVEQNFSNMLLAWFEVAGAEYYHLQISKNGLFTSLAISIDSIENNSRQLDSLLPNTRYYWRVKAWNSEAKNAQAWSEDWMFTTSGIAINLNLPSDQSTDVMIPARLRWYADPSTLKDFHVQVGKDIDFNEVIFDQEHIEDNKVYIDGDNVPALEDYGTYYWRVRAMIGSFASDYSDVWSFTIDRVSVTDIAEEINIYPIPASNHLDIDIIGLTSKISQYYLQDNNGRVVLENVLFLSNGNHHLQISLDGIASGKYFLVLQTEKGYYVKEIIIAK
ncbi:MAG: hypothetical protein B7C24_16975 [Bacteroidetes bacterium 4572_77]|nr:MAG: hypothetical protein B7C24_16975 [Bacteroidetes bacterium 4572_77]